MLENVIRPLYQRYMVNEVAIRIPEWLTANHLTGLAGAVGLMVLPALAFKLYWFATLLLLISGYLDTLDGTVARLHGQNSRFGAVLDLMMDRLVEISVILGLFTIAPETRAWPVMLMLGSIILCITSFLAVAIFTPNTSHKGFYHSPGIIERAELFIFFVVMIWLPDFFIVFSSLFTLAVLATGFLRIYQFWQQETHHQPATASLAITEEQTA